MAATGLAATVLVAPVFEAVVFFLVVDVWGAAHAPMARAAHKATVNGDGISRKNPV